MSDSSPTKPPRTGARGLAPPNTLGLDDADERNLAVIRATIKDCSEPIVERFSGRLFGLEGHPSAPESSVRPDPSAPALVPGPMGVEPASGVPGAAPPLEPGARVTLDSYAAVFEVVAGQLRTRLEAGALPSVLGTLNKLLWFDAARAVELEHERAMKAVRELSGRLEVAEQKVQELSRTDPLTEVLNRQHLLAALESEFDRSRRFRHPFSLLMVAVDDLARIGAQHGPAACDAVLKGAARLLGHMTRPSDVVGRYGFDEFVVGLVECEPNAAVLTGQRVCDALGPISHGGATIEGNLRVGIAALGAGGASLASFLSEAELALRRARAEGKVCFASGPAEGSRAAGAPRASLLSS